MISFIRAFAELHGDRRAVTALEYALVAGMLGAVVLAAFTGVGEAISAKMLAGIGSGRETPP